MKSLIQKIRGRMDYHNERWFPDYYLYRLQSIVQRLRFARLPVPQGGWPILLNISFPKSGTNLLSQILKGFTEVAPFSNHSHVIFAAYENRTGLKRSAEETLSYLNMLRAGDIATAHLPSYPEVVQRVCTPDFVPYFIFRDPRDVVVSHVFYVTGMASGHVHHRYYSQVLNSFEERLKTSILGLSDSPVEFPDIAQRFAVYTGWLEHPEVCILHFEDLIHERQAALGRVIEHFLRRVDTLRASRERIYEALERSIQPERSPTFRSGRTGEWQKYFNEEHKRLFKDVAGDLLVQLGYESDNNW